MIDNRFLKDYDADMQRWDDRDLDLYLEYFQRRNRDLHQPDKVAAGKSKLEVLTLDVAALDIRTASGKEQFLDRVTGFLR